MTTRRRGAILACVVALGLASCCPVPATTLAPSSLQRTAFPATVVGDESGQTVGGPAGGESGSWTAETPDGVRYRLSGPAPAGEGAPVYLEGTIDSAGNVTISTVRVIGGS